MSSFGTASRTVVLATALTGIATAEASQAEIDALREQLQIISARLQALENAQQGCPAADAEASNGSSDDAQRWITVADSDSPALSHYGLVEVEAAYGKADSDGSSSDVTVATVELGLDATLADGISASVSALYEEDNTDLEIDTATIQLSDLAGTDLSLTLGQTYLPFGRYETALVNDTLLLELAETRETAAVLSWENNALRVAAYSFNGDIDGGSDTLENFGASFSWNQDNYGLGVDYTGNIFDSDGLSAAFEASGIDLSDIENSVGAYIVSARASIDRILLLAEHLQTNSFSVGSFNQRKLQATHLEAATEAGAWTLALAWQQTDDAEELLPRQRLSLGASRIIAENLGLGLEYWHDKGYNDDTDADNLLLQLNLQF